MINGYFKSIADGLEKFIGFLSGKLFVERFDFLKSKFLPSEKGIPYHFYKKLESSQSRTKSTLTGLTMYSGV
jgi:hypothetical protein